MQRKAVRIITNSHRNADTNLIFRELQILPFLDLIHYSKSMFMHSVEYGYNKAFENTWTHNNQRNPAINLRNGNEFYLPPVNKEVFRKSTLYSLPHTWNNLGDIKYQPNRTTFKINLLYNLFENLNE